MSESIKSESIKLENIIEDLNWRYACKKFDPERKLTEKEVETLLESLRLTASSYGLEPWKFLLVKNQKLRDELVPACFGQKQITEASHLIVMCAKTDVDEKHVEAYLNNVSATRGVALEELEGFKKMLMMAVNKPDDKKLVWAKKQLYIAMGTLLTVCANLRIDSCPMEGFRPSEVDRVLGLKEKNLKSVLICPVGHRAKDDHYTSRLKVRFPKDQVIEVIE